MKANAGGREFLRDDTLVSGFVLVLVRPCSKFRCFDFAEEQDNSRHALSLMMARCDPEAKLQRRSTLQLRLKLATASGHRGMRRHAYAMCSTA